MDSRIWGDPEAFRPERFLAPDADRLPDLQAVIFGYGMR
jgi:cytochrome P450